MSVCVRVAEVPRGQLVLLLSGARPGGQGQLAHRRQVADHLVELAELGADLQQLPGVRRQVLHVGAARLLELVLPCRTTGGAALGLSVLYFNQK